MGKPPRIERKIIEKNRRNKMKNLYSQLLSLLPNPDSTSKVVEGAAPLPDQIDEAVEHIKTMKTKLQKLRHKKELLLQSIHDQNQPLIEVEVEVHDMGPNLDVVLANGLQNYSTFRRIIKLLHQSGLQIAAANFAINSSCIQLLHDNLQPKPDLDGATISRKLKEELLVSRAGASSSSEQVVEVESQHNLWDNNYEIHHSNSNWGFEIPEVLLPGLQEYMITMNKS